MALIRLYFAQLTGPDHGKYEIYREGVPTGEIVERNNICKLLSKDQFSNFVNGDDIFMVPGKVWRARNYKNKGNKGDRKIDL